MSGLTKRFIIFLIIFTFVTLCAAVVTLCAGVKFGTLDFGWIMGGGMMIGGFIGGAVATFPDLT